MAKKSLKINDFVAGPVAMFVAETPPDLTPYISGYYCTRIAPGAEIEDWMPPEEANLRTAAGEPFSAAIGDRPMKQVPSVIISGPTDCGTHLRISAGEYWGIGLTPAGWARIIGMPASDFANRFEDLADYPKLGALYEMLQATVADGSNVERVIERFNTTLRHLLGKPPLHEQAIHAIHLAIGSGKAHSSVELAAMAGMNLRTFERFCKRHFGFPPGALLRRQRFLRSLGRFMLDPSMRWIKSLDPFYSDQAHFIREFRAVMGMKPSEYAARPHPVVGAAVRVTNAAAGVAMQALHTPGPPDRS